MRNPLLSWNNDKVRAVTTAIMDDDDFALWFVFSSLLIFVSIYYYCRQQQQKRTCRSMIDACLTRSTWRKRGDERKIGLPSLDADQTRNTWQFTRWKSQTSLCGGYSYVGTHISVKEI